MSVGQQRRPPGRPRNEEADREIIAATLRLLAEQGYERTSIEAVAAEADVTRATVYRRYQSKSQLVCAALGAYPEPDVFEYEEITSNLLAGQGYTYASRDGGEYVASVSSPLYIVLTAGVYLVTNHNQSATLLVQAVLGGATAALVRMAGRVCVLAARGVGGGHAGRTGPDFA